MCCLSEQKGDCHQLQFLMQVASFQICNPGLELYFDFYFYYVTGTIKQSRELSNMFSNMYLPISSMLFFHSCKIITFCSHAYLTQTKFPLGRQAGSAGSFTILLLQKLEKYLSMDKINKASAYFVLRYSFYSELLIFITDKYQTNFSKISVL